MFFLSLYFTLFPSQVLYFCFAVFYIFILPYTEELNTYKINNEIKRVAYEITDNIGFEFDVYDGKLKVKQRFRKFHNKERRVNLLCINNETKKIEDFIKDKFIKKNKDRNIFNQWFFYTSYVFEGNENSVLCYKLKENYQDIRRYFQKNHNQIYKRKFTNVRVIKEEQINCLDYQIEKCEKWLENYRSEIKEYILGILILRYKARKHLNYMNRSIFSTSFTDILKTIVYTSIKEYYIIIRRILY